MNNFQKILNSTNADAVLIFSEIACNYLSGFNTTDGFVAVSKDKSALYTDGRYIEAATKSNTNCDVVLRTDNQKDIISFLNEIGAHNVAVETAIPYSLVLKLKNMLKDFEVSADENIDKCISKMRQVKTQDEIDKLRLAQEMTEKAFDYVLGFIKPGVTDIDIAAELEYQMRKAGANGLSFETICVTGTDTSLPHGVPHGRKVQNGDFVTMDFGALYQSLHADMTRTVAVGNITDEQKKVYNTVLSAQLNCINNIKAGMTGKEADLLSRSVIEQAGYGEYFTHSTGHSVGFEIHESPSLVSKNEQPLQEGNCVTVEPGIYLPSKFGVRIEDMVLITKDGCKNFTKADKALIIL